MKLPKTDHLTASSRESHFHVNTLTSSHSTHSTVSSYSLHYVCCVMCMHTLLQWIKNTPLTNKTHPLSTKHAPYQQTHPLSINALFINKHTPYQQTHPLSTKHAPYQQPVVWGAALPYDAFMRCGASHTMDGCKI